MHLICVRLCPSFGNTLGDWLKICAVNFFFSPTWVAPPENEYPFSGLETPGLLSTILRRRMSVSDLAAGNTCAA